MIIFPRIVFFLKSWWYENMFLYANYLIAANDTTTFCNLCSPEGKLRCESNLPCVIPPLTKTGMFGPSLDDAIKDAIYILPTGTAKSFGIIHEDRSQKSG